MNYHIEFTAVADEDLRERYLWIESQAGTAIADAYDARLRERLRKLAHFPNRGTPQDDVLVGMSSLSFERTMIIFYRVEGEEVTVIRVVFAVRDVAALFES